MVKSPRSHRKANERAHSYIYIVRPGYRCESPLCLIIYHPADIPHLSSLTLPENLRLHPLALKKIVFKGVCWGVVTVFLPSAFFLY